MVTGLYVGREPDNTGPCGRPRWRSGNRWERVDRSWRGIVMDTYALEKLTGWTPELSPPPGSPLYGVRALAGDVRLPLHVAALVNPQTLRPVPVESHENTCSDGSIDPLARHGGAAGPGRRIPRPRDQDGCAFCRRRRHRRAGADHRAKSQQQMGSARRRGKSAGRIRRDRDPGGDESAPRRLHVADGIDWSADGGVRWGRRRWIV